jgi:hypothetical protein
MLQPVLVWYIGLHLVSTVVARTRPLWYELRQYKPHTYFSLVIDLRIYQFCTTSFIPGLIPHMNMLHTSQISVLDPKAVPDWYESSKKYPIVVPAWYGKSNTI